MDVCQASPSLLLDSVCHVGAVGANELTKTAAARMFKQVFKMKSPKSTGDITMAMRASFIQSTGVSKTTAFAQFSLAIHFVSVFLFSSYTSSSQLPAQWHA